MDFSEHNLGSKSLSSYSPRLLLSKNKNSNYCTLSLPLTRQHRRANVMWNAKTVTMTSARITNQPVKSIDSLQYY